jgi:SAM-dependent methyltransferase
VSDRSPADERERVAASYERYAASPRKRRSWSGENPGNWAMRDEFISAAFDLAGSELRAAREILDVGCGTGWWLAALAERRDVSAALHGLEILPDRVAAARERAPAAAVVEGDALALPFADGRFDIVSLLTVLSSLSGPGDVRAALAEVRRVLGPQGVVIVWEPRLPNPFNRRTTAVSTRDVAAALGGVQIRSRSTTLLPPLARHLGRRADRLYPRLAAIPALRSHRVMCARPFRHGAG